MNGTATDGLAFPAEHMSVDLDSLGSRVPGVDEETGAAARDRLGGGFGRLADVAGWLAAAQQHVPAIPPRRPRCVLISAAGDSVGNSAAEAQLGAASLAEPFGVGVRVVGAERAVADAVRAGVEAADAEVDGGADLVVLVAAAAETDAAPAALVSVLTGVEPVAVLPRSTAALDSAAWSRRAGQVRDMRRAAMPLRSRPDALLAALDSPQLAATAGFLLRATGRRTPLVLDGAAALAAALLVDDIAPGAAGWWQAADASPDPVHGRACEELGLRPLLTLGISSRDGTAGLLSLPVLRAATAASR